MKAALVGLAFLLRATDAFSQGSYYERLHGLSGYSVSVKTGAQVPTGIVAEALRATIELEMRKAGINIVTNDSARSYVGDVNLSLSALSLSNAARPSEYFVYTLRIEVRRWLQTPGPDSTWFQPVAWSDSRYGYAPNVQQLGDAVSRFSTEMAISLSNTILASRQKK